MIGKMNYLEKSTRGDLAFSVHQCTQYMAHLMQSHGEAVKRIGRYLLGTRDKGFIVRPDMQKSFESYVDADYRGNWDPMHSEHPNSAKSPTGYVIMYHGCPILWASWLQSVFALSTTEAEYVALSTVLRDVILVIDLLQEMQDHGYSVDGTPSIKCKLFEDNSGVFEIVEHSSRRRQQSTNHAPVTLTLHGIISALMWQKD
jgi:hypothetical protein